MYISRVYLDVRKHDTARALHNLNILHGAIERCFWGERQHPLWRIDKNAGMYFVIIVSRSEPDFTSFTERFGLSGKEAQTKLYDTFLENGIKKGNIMRFHMRANPTIKKNGKRVPLNMKRTLNQQYCALDWLRDRMYANGAELVEGDITGYEDHRIKKDKETIKLISMEFDGYIKIIDKTKFVEALENGIGHGKAYGCGMISVMKAQ